MKNFIVLLLVTTFVLLGGCGTSQEAKQKASLHFSLGYNHLQQGDSTSALRELLEAEKYNPKDPDIQYTLGCAYGAKGQFAQALEHFKKTLLLNPNFTDAHNAMGSTYLEMGEWDKAIQEFEFVLKDILYLKPFYGWNNLGWAYYKKGDLPKSIECFKRAVGAKPDFGLAYYNLGLAYRDNKQTEDAIQAFRLALAQAPNLLEAHFQVGVLLFDSGRKEEARKSFQEVQRLAPQSETARLSQRYLDLLKKSSP